MFGGRYAEDLKLLTHITYHFCACAHMIGQFGHMLIVGKVCCYGNTEENGGKRRDDTSAKFANFDTLWLKLQARKLTAITAYTETQQQYF